MPFTFLSHQAVVLPLKARAPRGMSGTALVLGSMAPDVEYVIRTYPTGSFAHSWIGQIGFCLPVTMALYWTVTRLIAPVAAANLPDDPPLRLRDYALAGAHAGGASRWAIVGLCALTGSVSHILLDRAERALERVLANGVGTAGPSVETYGQWTTALIQIGGSTVLALVALALLARIGARRLIRQAAEARGVDVGARFADVSAARWRPAVFWGSAAAVAIASGATAFVTRAPGFFARDVATWAHVWLSTVAGGFTGLVLLSALWMARARRTRALVDSGGFLSTSTSSTSKDRR